VSSRILTLPRATRIGAVLAVASLALTACGSGSDDKAAGDNGSTSSGSKLSGTPIKIGYVASESGAQAQNGLAAKAVAHAWQEYTNANGGVLGHPVEIDMVDSKNTVPGATSAAKKFLSDDSVDAIFMTDLVAEGAMGDLFKDTPVPIISGGGSSDLLWSQVPGVFQDVSGSDYTIKSYVDQAKAAGAKNFGWAACAEVAVCATNGTKAEDYAKSVGLGATGVQQFSASASDYTAQCLAFTGKKTDAIAFNIGYAVGARVATDCLQQGYTGIFSVINSGFDQATFSKVSGFKSAGGTQGFPWWADDPQVATYRDAMKKYSPDGAWQSGNSTSIWSSFELFKKALENAKPTEITRSAALDAMYTINNETLGGLLPEPITYTKGQPSKAVGCSWLFTYNAGDDNPKSIAPDKSGNGASGDLASTCVGYLPGLGG
jgi:branched-chain amino acid transport system substrate-binding protein